MSDIVTTNASEREPWKEHIAWSILADRLKSRRTHARSTVLCLTIAGAALQTLAGTCPQVKTAAGIAGTIALALVPVIAGYLLKPEETRKWLRARSISEGIKSEFYTYRAGAAPYDGENPLLLLLAKFREIRNWGKDMLNLRAEIEEPKNPKPDPGPLGPNEYLAKRVYHQITEYYEPKAALNARMARRFRVLEILLAILTAVFSAIATASAAGNAGNIKLHLGPWVAVLTTIGGSLAAYALAGRYDFQATTFLATAAQLKDLVADWSTAGAKGPRSPEWSAFVRGCEEAISAENRGWMAKLEEKQDAGQGAAVGPGNG
jgi:hypothetical protein